LIEVFACGLGLLGKLGVFCFVAFAVRDGLEVFGASVSNEGEPFGELVLLEKGEGWGLFAANEEGKRFSGFGFVHDVYDRAQAFRKEGIADRLGLFPCREVTGDKGFVLEGGERRIKAEKTGIKQSIRLL
jgi:hypothetical protein